MKIRHRQSPEWPGILEERDDLLALAKPAGLDVFAAPRGRTSSLAGWLVARRPALASVGDAQEPAIAHRIDRGTSGLVLAACSRESHRRLRAALSDGSCAKDYLALVEGAVEESFEIDMPLGARHRRSRKVQPAMAGHALRGVRPARTLVAPLGRAGGKTLCLVRLATGMRHQIRAHLALAGHPIAGDRLYGAGPWTDAADGWFFLHAWRLQLGWASAGAPAGFLCPLPPARASCLERLGLAPPNRDAAFPGAEPGMGQVHCDL